MRVTWIVRWALIGFLLLGCPLSAWATDYNGVAADVTADDTFSAGGAPTADNNILGGSAFTWQGDFSLTNNYAITGGTNTFDVNGHGGTLSGNLTGANNLTVADGAGGGTFTFSGVANNLTGTLLVQDGATAIVTGTSTFADLDLGEAGGPSAGNLTVDGGSASCTVGALGFAGNGGAVTLLNGGTLICDTLDTTPATTTLTLTQGVLETTGGLTLDTDQALTNGSQIDVGGDFAAAAQNLSFDGNGTQLAVDGQLDCTNLTFQNSATGSLDGIANVGGPLLVTGSAQLDFGGAPAATAVDLGGAVTVTNATVNNNFAITADDGMTTVQTGATFNNHRSYDATGQNIQIAGANTTWAGDGTLDCFGMTVDDNASATFGGVTNITGSLLVSNNATLGFGTASAGTAVDVGDTLIVSNGATLNNFFDLTADDANIAIENGATFNNHRQFVATGRNIGIDGAAYSGVDGQLACADLTIDNSSTAVFGGAQMTGSLLVDRTSTCSFGTVQAGTVVDVAGTVTVNNGSTLTNFFDMTANDANTTVQGGATFTNNNLYDATGRNITVTGAGSTWAGTGNVNCTDLTANTSASVTLGGIANIAGAVLADNASTISIGTGTAATAVDVGGATTVDNGSTLDSYFAVTADDAGATVQGGSTMNVYNTWDATGQTVNVTGANSMLNVPGAMTFADMTVAADATLMGGGTLNTTAGVAVSGVLAPGNSIGTLNVAGANFTLGATGAFHVELSSTQADKLIVTGGEARFADGATFRAIPTQPIVGNKSFTIVESTGGIKDDGGAAVDLATMNKEISNTSAMLDFDLALANGDNDLVMNVTGVEASIAVTNNTGNNRGITRALDNGIAQGLGGAEVARLQTLNQADLDKSVEQLQPQPTFQMAVVGTRQSQTVHAATRGHVGTVRTALRNIEKVRHDTMLADASGDSPAAYEAAQANRMAAAERGTLWVWGKSLNDWGEVDGEGAVQGFEWDTHGMNFGVESLVTDNILVGASMSALWTDIDGDNASGSGEAETLYTNLYASWMTADLHVDAGFTHGYSWNDSRRPITALGLVAEGDFGSNTWSGFAGGGYNIEVDAFDVEPFLYYDYTHVIDNRNVERGAGGLNLVVNENSTSSLRQSLGVSVARTFRFEDGTRLRPHVRGAWEYEYLEDQVSTNVELLGTTYLNRGQDISRHTGKLTVGAEWFLQEKVSVVADYTASINRDWNDHSVNVALKIGF